ncbi:MAG: hypothetical protein EOS58_25445 [Mesorhizobium sp.]|nr:MAG: hypothetical protein EOS58_25445 [Mesorhizobium sp.]
MVFLIAEVTLARADCAPRFIDGDDLVGQQAWLAHNNPVDPDMEKWQADHFPQAPMEPGSYSGLFIPVLRQVGPTAWEPDGSRLPHGAQVTVKRVAAKSTDPTIGDDLEVELDSKLAVVSSSNVIGFDFRQCPASVLLSRTGDSKQLLEALPMRLKPGARPTDADGRWVEEQWLDNVEYLDCRHYGLYPANPTSSDCLVIWNPGIDLSGSRPLIFFVTDDMVEQVIGR